MARPLSVCCFSPSLSWQSPQPRSWSLLACTVYFQVPSLQFSQRSQAPHLLQPSQDMWLPPEALSMLCLETYQLPATTLTWHQLHEHFKC
ncbi:uncharacterized protein LOC117282106 isoform X2 [Cryptotermes secundus]|uniref:uncharacterized protein LOC117282106 isoform X2 n=1 Tax=Cryptotermes secundus TaxID=105785 RepID=UPI001454DA77|nr:uncharacterized protein LOC117282106 isoform X2 [Cryptotermes secundus]